MKICSYVLHDTMSTIKFEIDVKTFNKSQFEEAAYILKALANEIRLSVIALLTETEERTVTEMMEIIGCEQSLLSYHLTDMRAKGILSMRKSGKNCFYSIKNKRVIEMLSCVVGCKKEDTK